jgi:hypothetical protein
MARQHALPCSSVAARDKPQQQFHTRAHRRACQLTGLHAARPRLQQVPEGDEVVLVSPSAEVRTVREVGRVGRLLSVLEPETAHATSLGAAGSLAFGGRVPH